MQMPQPWIRGGTESKTGLKDTGVTMMRMEVAGLNGATTARDTVTGIQVIVTDGRKAGMTEASIDETVGQGPDPRGGHDLGTGIMGDGEAPRKD